MGTGANTDGTGEEGSGKAHCFRHPPVAEVGKVPMIARRYTEHRNYNDGRHGTIHSGEGGK